MYIDLKQRLEKSTDLATRQWSSFQSQTIKAQAFQKERVVEGFQKLFLHK